MPLTDRIDALGHRPERHRAFRGRVLSQRADEELQRVVVAAADELGAPVALVTLVLDHVQFFRAHHGLPEDLVLAGVTERDVSFCQFVVASEAMFEVNDAPRDERVPQALVKKYGMSAYLGAPLQLSGEVVGSLCVLDVVARRFDDEEKVALDRLARVATARLIQLADAHPEPSRGPPSEVLEPAVREVKEALGPVAQNLTAVRIAAVELPPRDGVERPEDATADEGAPTERRRRLAFDSALDELGSSVQRLEVAVESLEGLAVSGWHRAVMLAEVVEDATRLARPTTGANGGAHTAGPLPACHIAAPRAMAVAAIARGLTSLAATPPVAEPKGILVSASEDGDAVVIRVSAPAAPSDAFSVAAGRVARLIGDELTVATTATDRSLVIRLLIHD